MEDFSRSNPVDLILLEGIEQSAKQQGKLAKYPRHVAFI
jgi:hypothetical protein